MDIMDKNDQVIDLELGTVPELTLEPVLDDVTTMPEIPAEPKPETAILSEDTLSDEEKALVEDFSKKIELNNANLIMQYGSGAQKKIANFSETALEQVRTKDMGEVGKMLTDVVVELKGFDADEEKGLFGMFKKTGNKMTAMKAKYDKAEANIDKITSSLENHQVTLMKDVAMLDKMYELNKVYFKELNMYILAGKKKLEEVRTKDMPALMAKAEETGLPEDAQAVNDLANLCDRFEKKLYDLELTRMISIQMAPQIRMVQNNDILMSEKIQSTLVNTIPLWKSQMVLALGVAHSQDAAKAQREVTNMTNELLKKNAATLKTASVEVAKESERGIVDLDTLRTTNQSLISTLDEVMRIQEDGRAKRGEAEKELGRIEGELKTKMLEIYSSGQKLPANEEQQPQ